MSAPIKITPMSLAAGAAARWHDHYCHGGSWMDSSFPAKGRDVVHSELMALGRNPTPAQVQEVIGNNSWTRVPDCDGCGREDEPFVVGVGHRPDYDSNMAHLCGTCIGLAWLEAGVVLNPAVQAEAANVRG